MSPEPKKTLAVGNAAHRTDVITDDSITEFAQVSGDRNPIHLDDAAASDSIFGQRIAHGFLVASRISALLAEEVPGPGTIYLGQDLRFAAPVFVGDHITTTVTVAEEMKPTIWRLETTCVKADGTVVITGTATVKAPS